MTEDTMLTDYNRKGPERPQTYQVMVRGRRRRFHRIAGTDALLLELNRRYGAGVLDLNDGQMTYLPHADHEDAAVVDAALEDKPDVLDGPHGIDGGSLPVTGVELEADLEADVDPKADA